MEDWQGCLSPACQAALTNARDSVIRRGGYAVTLEDFLLAMLDEIPEMCRFLQRQGVDLDELTRTIQCEQPIVTAVASEDLLSSQLTYWFSRAREVSSEVWLEWPTLLQTLVHSAERLQEKAFVAVLELVAHWPFTGADAPGNRQEGTQPAIATVSPVVMADANWLGLVEDVSVVLSAVPRGLVWICGARGSGKSSLLRSLLETLPCGAIEVDIRREADILASNQPAVPAMPDPDSIVPTLAPTLVLDNVSPADLMTMMTTEFSVARELVTSFPGPILLLGSDSAAAEAAIEPLQQTLGRDLDRFNMPLASAAQKRAILTAHQPMIEKRWGIELTPGLVEYVAASRNSRLASPGALLQWVERAAARLNLFAERGPLEIAVLDGQAETLRRQSLLAMARHHPTEQLDESLQTLAIECAAREVSWHERKREGTLRFLKIDDLRSELERRVAAGGGAGHYIAEQRQIRELELA